MAKIRFKDDIIICGENEKKKENISEIRGILYVKKNNMLFARYKINDINYNTTMDFDTEKIVSMTREEAEGYICILEDLTRRELYRHEGIMTGLKIFLENVEKLAQ